LNQFRLHWFKAKVVGGMLAQSDVRRVLERADRPKFWGKGSRTGALRCLGVIDCGETAHFLGSRLRYMYTGGIVEGDEWFQLLSINEKKKGRK
jgi:hypothetical protein